MERRRAEWPSRLPLDASLCLSFAPSLCLYKELLLHPYDRFSNQSRNLRNAHIRLGNGQVENLRKKPTDPGLGFGRVI
jgi:hypothetical protein